MKSLIKKLLREGTNNIRYDIEHLDSYNGQHNYELGMYVNDEIMGMVEYVLHDGELSVSNILVRPEFRRKGYGSRMMQYLKEKYKGEYEYVPSMQTSDGAAFKHKDIADLNSLNEKILNKLGNTK